jgi:hypothetical protein
MRFMMLMIPEVYQGTKGKSVDPIFAPPADPVEKIISLNEDLVKAGALIAGDVLHPLSSDARVSYPGGKPMVTDGPFTESKEVLGGYSMIKVKSKAEAIEWAKRIPAGSGDVVEIRQVQEMDDFPPEVQNAAKIELVNGKVSKGER